MSRHSPKRRIANRERLSPIAVKAFRNIVEHWKLTNAEAAMLLGVSESTWDRIKRGAWDQPLSQDQLTRASAAIGIHKGLRLLFADDHEFSCRWYQSSDRAADRIQVSLRAGAILVNSASLGLLSPGVSVSFRAFQNLKL